MLGSNPVYGLTDKQLAEWDRWLTERRPAKRVFL
jgi:hypothetical protein